jgi:hypothetical protein
MGLFLHSDHTDTKETNERLWNIAFEEDDDKPMEVLEVDRQLIRRLLVDLCKIAIDHPLAYFRALYEVDDVKVNKKAVKYLADCQEKAEEMVDWCMLSISNESAKIS